MTRVMLALAGTLIATSASAAEPPFARDLLFDAKGHSRSWAQIVTEATKRAIRFRGNKYTTHSCIPEEGVCADGIVYPDEKDNSAIMVVVRSKPSGKVVTRNVCRFNIELDLRFCYDYDSQTIVTHMKDEKGDWQFVENETDEPKDESLDNMIPTKPQVNNPLPSPGGTNSSVMDRLFGSQR